MTDDNCRQPLKFDPIATFTIKTARGALGLTQAAMAASLGLGIRQYNKMERGRITPCLRTRMAIRWLLINACASNQTIIADMLIEALIVKS